MIARVVPLRRFDPVHDWFDYDLPPNLSLQPGHLVAIPFLRQTLPGIVWELTATSDSKRLRTVSKILRPEPVMSEWQMHSLGKISRDGFVSLGHLILSSLPKYPKQDQAEGSSTVLTPIAKNLALEIPKGSTWWYRNRLQAVAWILTWLSKPGGQRLVIVPSIADGEALTAEAARVGLGIPFVSGQQPIAAYRRTYEGVRNGQITRVIGTSRACLLPYSAEPEVLLDQEEHPSHKLTERHPRLDNRWLVRELFTRSITTTPAPSLHYYHAHHPHPPTGQSPRRLASLDRPKQQPWITQELASLLDGQQKLLLILPRGTSVRALQCQTCGLKVGCQRCGQRLRWQATSRALIACQACGLDQSPPEHCTRCGSAGWSVRGLTLESFQRVLQRGWPGRSLSTSWPPISSTDTWLGTYQSYRWLGGNIIPDAIVVVSGDQLRAWSDFSADERAWQYLARLQASSPTVPVVAQTDAPDDPFWQRWQAADDQAWYTDEVKVRQQLKTPPFIDQWILRHPRLGGELAASTLSEWLYAHASDVRLEPLPNTNFTSATYRWLLTAPTKQSLAALIPARQILPTPWTIDPWVTSWLE